MASRKFLIDPIAQLRFILVLSTVLIGALLAASVLWWAAVLGPAFEDVTAAASSGGRTAESAEGLLELATNVQLPDEQRASLARSQSAELDSTTTVVTMRLASASRRLRNPIAFLGGLLAALVFGGMCGVLWSRRISQAEDGIVRRLEGLVDGDLRLEAPAGPYAELHTTQRGLRRTVEELRSITRRDMQLMAEVGQSARHICEAVSLDPGISSDARDQLRAAADKIDELRRISERPRL
jgi:hypothetical protein